MILNAKAVNFEWLIRRCGPDVGSERVAGGLMRTLSRFGSRPRPAQSVARRSPHAWTWRRGSSALVAVGVLFGTFGIQSAALAREISLKYIGQAVIPDYLNREICGTSSPKIYYVTKSKTNALFVFDIGSLSAKPMTIDGQNELDAPIDLLLCSSDGKYLTVRAGSKIYVIGEIDTSIYTIVNERPARDFTYSTIEPDSEVVLVPDSNFLGGELAHDKGPDILAENPKVQIDGMNFSTIVPFQSGETFFFLQLPQLSWFQRFRWENRNKNIFASVRSARECGRRE